MSAGPVKALRPGTCTIAGRAKRQQFTRPGGGRLLFTARNGHPSTVLDARQDHEAAALLSGMTVGPEDFPLVFCPDGSVLRAPDEVQLATCLGLAPSFESAGVYDVAIVGAGPAGLAAAVYAATEGLSVAVIAQIHAYLRPSTEAAARR